MLVTEWPAELNAYRFFLGDRITGGDGGRVALRVGDADLSYLDVDRLVAGYEDALRGSGVGIGDRVLLVLPDSPDYAAALLAAFRMGAVVVMLNPGLMPEALSAIVDLSAAAAAVVHRDHHAHFTSSLGRHHPRLIDPETVRPRDHVTEPAPTRPRDPAIWLFSGGTTGVPKAVAQTHMSLVNTTRRYGQGSLGLDGDDITMAIPKLYFGYATGSNLLFPFSVGASAVLFPEHPTPEVIFEQIARHRPTVLVNVPSAINQMLSVPDARSHDLSSLRLATSAGEALPETLYRRWVDTFGVELLDGLGTAEMWHIFITNTPAEVRPGHSGPGRPRVRDQGL